MELIPLALALVVLWKVESSHADGNADMEFYRNKLAKHCDRNCDRACHLETEQIHQSAECHREARQAVDGSMRSKEP